MELKKLKRRKSYISRELRIALKFGSKARVAELAKLLSEIIKEIKLRS